MKATTLWQPYASLVAIGAKPFETRSYPPPAKLIGQRIAIHAAARPIQLTWRDLDLPTRAVIIDAFVAAELKGRADDLPHGAVVCTAVVEGAGKIAGIDDRLPTYVSGIVHMRERRGDMPASIYTDHFGDYFPGRWAWLLTDVRRLAVPEPAKGKQGWWQWEPRCPYPVIDDPSAKACVGGGVCGCCLGGAFRWGGSP